MNRLGIAIRKHKKLFFSNRSQSSFFFKMQNFKGYECSSRALPVEVRAIEPDLVFYKKKSRGKGKMGRERTQACDLERVSSLLVTTLIVWEG
jgi:hypothetical protein